MSDEERWAAVIRRDRSVEEEFYYSVETTGVYCRPGCGARLAKRENVKFHETCEAAEGAGFRACQRCRPNELQPATQRARAIEAACRSLELAEELPDLDQLARAASMSRFHFQRVFKELTRVTPRAYFLEHRNRKVRQELTRGGSVTDAIYRAGFNSNGRFYESSPEFLGMTPTEFRAGGEGTEIQFAVGECSLGSILVAASTKGICSILLGADPEALVQDLEKQFPKANLIGGNREFERRVAEVVGLIETPSKRFDMPLDIRGTAFQQLVWQALRAIPSGATLSYQEIAKRIGKPSASRAVARACAANALAVAIPCHRVVRSDGDVSGYRWGVDRKRALLARESVTQSS